MIRPLFESRQGLDPCDLPGTTEFPGWFRAILGQSPYRFAPNTSPKIVTFSGFKECYFPYLANSQKLSRHAVCSRSTDSSGVGWEMVLPKSPRRLQPFGTVTSAKEFFHVRLNMQRSQSISPMDCYWLNERIYFPFLLPHQHYLGVSSEGKNQSENMAPYWTHLVRFIAKEDGQVHLGQVDSTRFPDVGLAMLNGEKLTVREIKGICI